ncbi:DUF262 domain-containing protein [Occultella glacieicola]|uniref:DUF262 domain-containing protein n=1 Tax=Occultella glacieicola TaxID=2518684 RepID=A0ABY2E6D8_9MICO|nr:DUF262 domain-containing protein [Occultella glacieicola]TDE95076.1 DUF262 domain-containing protein [Occultella glacieicola]
MTAEEAPVLELPDETIDGESPPDDVLTPADLDQIVLYTVDWSVQSILERIGESFDINPTFQRRDAWTASKKSAFIESLILGLPIPQIVLAEDKRRGRFIVLDGKQRLVTLKQFASPSLHFPEFRLRGMRFANDLEGLTFGDMQASLLGGEYADNFLTQPIRTVVVRNWGHPAVLYEVFIRLNQNSLPLSPQELRQALFPNEFTRWINSRSAKSAQLHRARRIKAEDFRMRDAEMLLRYVAWVTRFKDYRGNLRLFLDETCELGGRKWAERGFEYFEELAARCERGIDRTFEVFRDDAFLRFDGGKYNRRFNIAVFDLMAVVLGDESLADEKIRDVRVKIRTEFERLCTEDETFRTSITATTKSVTAVSERFETWASAVEEIADIDLRIKPAMELLTRVRVPATPASNLLPLEE